MSASNILRDTLASVLVELERLDPNSLIAARARGVLDATAGAGTQVVTRSGWRKKADARDHELVALYQTGLPAAEVAQKAGCAAQTVFAALRRVGVPVRARGVPARPTKVSKANESRIERIRAGRANGLTLEAIGAQEGITRERVRQLAVKAGIDTSHTELTCEEKAAVERYLAGDSLDLTAESIGRSSHSMRRILFQAGHKPRPSPRTSKRHPQTIANAERCVELYTQGMKVREIAAAVGVSKPEMIYRLLAIGGIKADRIHRVRLSHAPARTNATAA